MPIILLLFDSIRKSYARPICNITSILLYVWLLDKLFVREYDYFLPF